MRHSCRHGTFIRNALETSGPSSAERYIEHQHIECGINKEITVKTIVAVLLFAGFAFGQSLNPPRQLVFRAGFDNGPAMVDLQVKSQRRLYGMPTNANVSYIVWQCDQGATSVQLAYRHQMSQVVVTPVLVPALSGAVTGTIACASINGVPVMWEGSSVPCATLANNKLKQGDTIETTNAGAADGVSTSCSAFMVVQ